VGGLFEAYGGLPFDFMVFQAGSDMYKYETVIRMRNTDAAGLVFYAEVFVLAHECYESFLEEHPWARTKSSA